MNHQSQRAAMRDSGRRRTHQEEKTVAITFGVLKRTVSGLVGYACKAGGSRLLAAVVGVVVLAAGGQANAVLLGGFEGSSGPGGTGSANTAIDFYLFYGVGGSSVPGSPKLASASFSTDGVFTFDSGTDFSLAASMITDGIDSLITALTTTPNGGGGGHTATEATRLFGDPTGASGIDLFGFSITEFVLTISNVFIDSPGQDPNGNGQWTDYAFDWRLDVFGDPVGPAAVPVSATLPLFGLGLAGLGLAARRRRAS